MADKNSTQTFLQHQSTESVNNTKKLNEKVDELKSCGVGAPSEIPVNHPDIIEYVAKAEKKLSAEYPGDNHPRIKETIKATRKVVAGFLYKINVTVGTSDCPKSQELTSGCVLLGDSPVKEYEITVWTKSWENFEEIKITCKE